MEKKFDIIGIEDLLMDFPVQLDRIPATDGGARMRDFVWQSGGNASSAIVAAARLGGKCAMVGSVGNDPFGDFCRNDMTMHGVDISHIKILEGETTFVLCLAEVETQGRSFVGYWGVHQDLTPEEIDEEFIKSARAVHANLSNRFNIKTAFDFARKNDVLVSVDAAFAYEGCEEDAKHVDLLVMSEYFYKSLFGENDTNYEENCKKYLDYGCKAVVVTLGGKGCAGADAHGTFRIPAQKGTMWDGRECKIIDTTGAGDVFHGAFTYAWLYRYQQAPYNYTVEDCARFASTVSYIDCLALGGRTGIPTLEMVDHFLETSVVLPGDIQERHDYYHTAMFKRN